MARTDVLIVGAGPTGLVLAVWLTRQGVPIRIIDKTEATASTSRALAIHARTLELYRQLDIADEVVASGHKLEATNIWSQGVHKAHIKLGDVGKGLTPYPYILIYPQDRHEKLLEGKLNGLGVHVERGRELADFTEHDGYVTARLRNATATDNIETCEATFIVGCDGSHSAVRHSSGIDFQGAKYTQAFFVTDIEGRGPVFNGDSHLTLNDRDFMLLFPYDGQGKARMAGAVDESTTTKPISELTFDDVAPQTIQKIGVKVDKVNWFTTYHVHHRVAETFHKPGSRAFLVGDAAHIHSPVGGQGMNTGIGDAINLAWKLASVIHGRADKSILNTYDDERRAFANTLVNSTDHAFGFLVSDTYMSKFVREWAVPFLAPILSHVEFVRRRAFRGASQIELNYQHSALSKGSAGIVQGGDRVPWLMPVQGELDNFNSLRGIAWHVHVYGSAVEELAQWCREKGIALRIFPWNEKCATAGLLQNAAYLVRPDTYVVVAEPSGLPSAFEEYLTTNQISTLLVAGVAVLICLSSLAVSAQFCSRVNSQMSPIWRFV